MCLLPYALKLQYIYWGTLEKRPLTPSVFFGLSPCGWIHTKTFRSGAEHATQHRTGKPRAAWKLLQSAHTSGTILDRVLCFLHLFTGLFVLPTDGKVTHPVEKERKKKKTGRTKIMTIMLTVRICSRGNKLQCGRACEGECNHLWRRYGILASVTGVVATN